MADFCLDCWNKLNESNDNKSKYIFSKELDLCEGCGEWKHVIVEERWYYYQYKLRYFILPFRVVCGIILFLLRLLFLPYMILKLYRRDNH